MIQRPKQTSLLPHPSRQQTLFFSDLTIAEQALLSRAITYILIYGDTFILFYSESQEWRAYPFNAAQIFLRA